MSDAALMDEVGVCVVRVGDERFCVETLQVREVLGHCEPQPVPLAPMHLAGLLPYRGEVLPAISLHALLGVVKKTGAGCVVVLPDEATGETFGLVVDGVEEVLRISAVGLEPNPATLDERRRRIFSGVYRTEQGVMARLDPRTLQPSAWQEMSVAGDVLKEGHGTCEL